MFKIFKELYSQYREYVRVDLVMYSVLIILILIYFIITVLS